MGQALSKSKTKEIPQLNKINKSVSLPEFLETPNTVLLNSVMKKYPVSVQKPISITSYSEFRPRKMNLSEFCNSLNSESMYCIPKMIKDDQDIKWVWK